VLEALKIAQGAADRLRAQAREEAAEILQQADEEATAHARELVAALAAAVADSGAELDPGLRNLAPELDLRPLLAP